MVTNGNTFLENEYEFSKNLKCKNLGSSYAFFKSIGSTNMYIKFKGLILPDGFCAVASEQFVGRGRLGKSFVSPTGGLYMSVFIKNGKIDCEKLTVKAAVAVCRALERSVGIQGLKIKWVNDILYKDKKLCGILAERVYITSDIFYTVLGIGINVNTDCEFLGEELSKISVSLKEIVKRKFSVPALCAQILNELEPVLKKKSKADLERINDEYRERSVVIGKDIVIYSGNEQKNAKVLGIDDKASLYVEYEDGKTDIISAGEISIRLSKKKSEQRRRG